MIQMLEQPGTTGSSSIRLELRSQLENNGAAFRSLIDALPEERWNEKSQSCAWTNGEVLVHLTWALEHLPEEIASARRGQGMFNMPGRIADPLSYWYTRWLSRGATRDSIRQRYDQAIQGALAALDDVPDTDWDLGARFYGERFYTVAELFRSPTHHFETHTAGMFSGAP